jgi:hypothetical protein
MQSATTACTIFSFEGLACLTVGDQLGAAEQTLAAQIANGLVLLLQRLKFGDDAGAHFRGVFERAFVLNDAEILKRLCGTRGAAAKC